MRDNFRPNVRLITNILMVVGTFLIAFNLSSVNNQDKKFIKRRDDCAELAGKKITLEDFIKKYNLASKEGYKKIDIFTEPRLVSGFCSFYRLGTSK